jgi:hypothetical protein
MISCSSAIATSSHAPAAASSIASSSTSCNVTHRSAGHGGGPQHEQSSDSLASSAMRGQSGVCSKAYTAMLDLKPGDEFEIKLGRKQIKLIPLGSAEEE